MASGVDSAGDLLFFLIMLGPSVQKTIKHTKKGPVRQRTLLCVSSERFWAFSWQPGLAVGSEEVGVNCGFKQKSIMGGPRAQDTHSLPMPGRVSGIEWLPWGSRPWGWAGGNLWTKAEGKGTEH